MARGVAVGAGIDPYGPDWAAVRDAFLRCEAAGADALFTYDHFFQSGDGEAVDGPNFECYSILAAVAASTETARLGALVACHSYRNPHLHADMARTIDHISSGRFILGIGSGWFELDYTEYGYEFGTVRSRLDALRDGLSAIRTRLDRLTPLPVQERLPVLVAGTGRKVMLRMVAEYADAWHAFGTPDEFAELSAVLDEHCRAIGRDPSEIERIAWVEPTELDRADAYAAVGVDLLLTSVTAPAYDAGALRELVAWRDGR